MTDSPEMYRTTEEMIEVANRLEALARAGKIAPLRPETAYLAGRAIRMLAAAPTHNDLMRAMCRSFREGKCTGTGVTGCISCMGLANAAHAVMMARRTHDA